MRNGCADSWLAGSDLDDAHGYALILVALGVAKRELETLQSYMHSHEPLHGYALILVALGVAKRELETLQR